MNQRFAASLIAALCLIVSHSNDSRADEPTPVRVLVWDEQQPEQKQAYGDKFLGETIAAHLAKQPGITVRMVNIDSPEQGLDAATLDAADVIIWWGHKQHDRVSTARAEQVVQRVLDGKLALIALHSAHFSQPFMRLMHERAKADAPRMVPVDERDKAKIDFSAPLKRDCRARCAVDARTRKNGRSVAADSAWLHLSGVARGRRTSHVTTLLPKHPIAAGLPEKWDIPHTEMYDEPFHIPAPDAVIFEEHWDKGEHFRSGCVWQVGHGRVFYFRPGHETYPVYQQAEPLRVLENAVRWLAQP